MIELGEDDVSAEEFEAVIQSRGFQKMLLYHRIAEGLGVLEEHDRLFDSMVAAITKQHSEFESEEVTREFLELFIREIRTYTDPFDEGIAEIDFLPERLRSAPDYPGGEREGERVLRKTLEAKLREQESVQFKASDLAAETDLHSTHIGSILGRWRKFDDSPFEVTATEAPNTSNLWTITHPTAHSG